MANDLELVLNEALAEFAYDVALSCVYDLLTQVEMEMEDPELSADKRVELESKALALYSQSWDLRSLIEGTWDYPEEF